MAPAPRRSRRVSAWEILTLDRLMTGTVSHLVYWSGLGIIALVGFASVGTAIGFALREGSLMGWLLALPVLVSGLVVVCALTLIWRAFCEFYVVVMRIGEDLHALRTAQDAEIAAGTPARDRAQG